jgi:hypothetical protein
LCPAECPQAPDLQWGKPSGRYNDASGCTLAAENTAARLNILNPDFVPNASTLNKVTAFDFYANEAGFNPSVALDHMHGTDFSRSLSVTTLPEGTALQQYVGAGGPGNYFSPIGTTPLQAGIDATDRSLGAFRNVVPVRAVRSFAAPDYLYPPGTVVPGSGAGGGVNFLFPITAFAPVQ